MQGQGMAGERRPVYPAWIHWMGGDNGVMGGSNETPRTGRGGWWLFICRPSRFYIVCVYIVLVLQEVYRLSMRLFSSKAGAYVSCYGIRYRLQLG